MKFNNYLKLIFNNKVQPTYQLLKKKSIFLPKDLNPMFKNDFS